MKKLFKIAMVAILVMVGTTAKAQDCSKSIDSICETFNNISNAIGYVSSLEQFETLDFSAAIMSGCEVPEECLSYTLTKDDKKRIQKSLDGFVDAMINKTYELTGGMMQKSQIDQMMGYPKKTFKQMIDQATTLQDLGAAFSQFEM